MERYPGVLRTPGLLMEEKGKGMNVGTKLRTILVIATCINTALMATDITEFNNPTLDAIYKVASIVLNFIIVGISTYFNNDFTEEAARTTGMMRLLKAQRKGIITGEDFTPIEDEGEEEDGEL